jgi:hypothetical protein
METRPILNLSLIIMAKAYSVGPLGRTALIACLESNRTPKHRDFNKFRL